ncbi:MAG: hypothetical protein ABI547_05665 [Betaproteobacteria bacterium]
MALPFEKAGYKIRHVTTDVAVDGSQIAFGMQVCDPATEAHMAEYKFHTDFDGLSMLLGNIIQASAVTKTMLEKTGKMRPDKSGATSALMLNVDSGGAGEIPDHHEVALEIRSNEGPVLRFALSPYLAQALGHQMIEASKKVVKKLGQH